MHKVEQAVSPALSFCFSLPLPPAWQFPGPRGTWRGPRGQPGDPARDAPARGGDPAVLGGGLRLFARSPPAAFRTSLSERDSDSASCQRTTRQGRRGLPLILILTHSVLLLGIVAGQGCAQQPRPTQSRPEDLESRKGKPCGAGPRRSRARF